MKGTLILCGRIESAVGRMAYSTHKMLIEQGNNSYFIGLNNSLNYVKASYLDFSVNSKIYIKKKFEINTHSKHYLKALIYKTLLIIFTRLYDDRIHGVIYNKKRIYRQIKKTIKKYNIERIIAFYKPPEILEIAYKIGEEKSIMVTPFFLDNAIIDHIARYDYYFLSSSVFLCAPWVLQDKWFKDKYLEKICEVNLPIIPWDQKENYCNEKDMSFILFGALYDDIRNPECLFEAFLTVEHNFIIKTFCSGCREILSHYKDLMKDKLLIHEFVPVDVLHKEILNSNIAIVIGNSIASQTPSKLFELIGSGKPIIYLYQNNDDIALRFIRNYPLSYVVKYSELNKNEEVKKLFKWCDMHKNDKINYNDYINMFADFSIDKYLRRICDE